MFASRRTFQITLRYEHILARTFARKRPELRLPPPSIKKRLDCVIFGSVNVGKSVLLNSLVKDKLAATSRKKHTTRGEILGVFNHRNTQLVFFDTPGFTTSNSDKKMKSIELNNVTVKTLERADVVILVVDAALSMDSERFAYSFTEMVKKGLRCAKKELILVLNKVDLVEPKSRLLDMTHRLISLINGVKLSPDRANQAELDTTTFMISALNNDGVLDLKNYLIKIAEEKEWLIPANKGNTTLSMKERVEELILENLLDNTHDEIPYVAEIECKHIKQISATKVRVDVDISFSSARHVRIVIGHQGRTLLCIRQKTSEQLERVFGKTVLLFIWVKSTDGKSSVNLEQLQEQSHRQL